MPRNAAPKSGKQHVATRVNLIHSKPFSMVFCFSYSPDLTTRRHAASNSRSRDPDRRRYAFAHGVGGAGWPSVNSKASDVLTVFFGQMIEATTAITRISATTANETPMGIL